jgi:O-antigen ligase
MGFGALCAVNLMLEHRSWRWGIVVLALTSGVFWSGSKGPILAYFVAVFFLFISCAKYFRRLILQSFLGLIILILAAYQLDLHSLLSETRFGLLLQVANEGVDIKEGSVGARISSYAQALELIGQNFPLGIGPGNFALYDQILMYPHNVHLEILLEYGFFPFIVYVAVIVYALARSSPLIRAIILFFLICMSFSGDASYLRFILPFILLCTVSKPQPQWRQPSPRQHSVSSL